MSELVWTFQDGSLLVAEMNGLQLVVRPAEIEREFRYQIFSRSISAESSCVCSGQHAQLCEAMVAAERRAKLFSAQLGSVATTQAVAEPLSVDGSSG